VHTIFGVKNKAENRHKPARGRPTTTDRRVTAQ